VEAKPEEPPEQQKEDLYLKLLKMGNAEEYYEKLKQEKITEDNIEYLGFEDFKNLGIPIGPARQLYETIRKLKKGGKGGWKSKLVEKPP